MSYFWWLLTLSAVSVPFAVTLYTAWKMSVFGVFRVSLRIQSECGKIRARKTLNKHTFYAVIPFLRTYFSADIYLLKVTNRNTRMIASIWFLMSLLLTLNMFIWHLVLVFLLLSLNMELCAGLPFNLKY